MNAKKDRFFGKVKKVAGKLTNNKQLELEGKIQIAKANFSDRINVKKNANKLKEKLARKINDRLDKASKKRSRRK